MMIQAVTAAARPGVTSDDSEAQVTVLCWVNRHGDRRTARRRAGVSWRPQPPSASERFLEAHWPGQRRRWSMVDSEAAPSAGFAETHWH